MEGFRWTNLKLKGDEGGSSQERRHSPWAWLSMPRRKLDVLMSPSRSEWSRGSEFWLAWAIKRGCNPVSQSQSEWLVVPLYCVTNITSYVWPSYNAGLLDVSFYFLFSGITNISKEKEGVRMIKPYSISLHNGTKWSCQHNIRGADLQKRGLHWPNGYHKALYRRAFTRFLLSDFWSGLS